MMQARRQLRHSIPLVRTPTLAALTSIVSAPNGSAELRCRFAEAALTPGFAMQAI
jgi:hypothetical protein